MEYQESKKQPNWDAVKGVEMNCSGCHTEAEFLISPEELQPNQASMLSAKCQENHHRVYTVSTKFQQNWQSSIGTCLNRNWGLDT